MPQSSTTESCDGPCGFQRGKVLAVGVGSLAIAAGGFILWQDRIFSHLDFTPAQSQVLEIRAVSPFAVEIVELPGDGDSSPPVVTVVKISDPQ